MYSSVADGHADNFPPEFYSEKFEDMVKENLKKYFSFEIEDPIDTTQIKDLWFFATFAKDVRNGKVTIWAGDSIG